MQVVEPTVVERDVVVERDAVDLSPAMPPASKKPFEFCTQLS